MSDNIPFLILIAFASNLGACDSLLIREDGRIIFKRKFCSLFSKLYNDDTGCILYPTDIVWRSFINFLNG